MAGKRGCVKRQVLINGELCESLTKAARKASEITDSRIEEYQIRRLLKGEIKIAGIIIKEFFIESVPECKKVFSGMLLNYPLGENPIERGLPAVWR